MTLAVCRTVLVSCVMAIFVGAAMPSSAADSFTIRCDWLDRGNVATTGIADGYSDKYRCIVDGSVRPNQAEYDLDFPVAADYTISALYASGQPRPVEILLDGKLLVVGFKGATGGFQTSSAKWETQGTAKITQGKHTLKLLCQGACIPHICALRFESPEPFPKDWKLARRPAPSGASVPLASKPEASSAAEPERKGFLGDYPLEPPNSYDYLQPVNRRIPLPHPRAQRILEYTLMGGKYQVTAEILGSGADPKSATAGSPGRAPSADDPARNELLQSRPDPSAEQTPWVARLSVKIDDKRTESETLPLSPADLKRILAHTTELVDDFRSMDGVARDFLANEREEAAKMAAVLQTLFAEPDSQAKWERFYQLYAQAYQLKNRVALKNPLLAFNQLVLAKRLTYNTSHIYTIYFDGSERWKAGSGLYALSPVRPDGKLTNLTPKLTPDGIYRDPDLYWDAKKLLFSYKADRKTPFLIHEVGLDGKGLRQLTKAEYDDVDPCYLPDDRIAFISTRCERVVLCHNAFTVSVLHSMDKDGSDVRCISTNTINDFTPSVLADGQIAVSQWRYVDMHVGNNQSLWRCNPDGTRNVHVAGAHFGPVTYWGARQVPGSQSIACILGPHMPYPCGPVALVNPMWSYSSPQVFTNVTPDVPPPTHIVYQRPEAGHYADVFPLSERYFLVSYSYGPGPEEPTGYGVYLLDRSNNRDLVYRDPEFSAFESFPVRPRPRPPIIVPRTEQAFAAPNHANPATAEYGVFYLLNVYDGLPGIPRGTIRWLRIIEEIAKPVSSRTQGYGLQNPVISHSGHFAVKRIWGIVPVEADGSAHFLAPANRAIYFSALDENFMEIQRMRSYTSVAPGESYGCIGCHERTTTAPAAASALPSSTSLSVPEHPTPNTEHPSSHSSFVIRHSSLPAGPALALRRPPSPIQPPRGGGVHTPDFYHDAQPVLNRHCASCHTGPHPKNGIDLSPDFTNLFNVAYETLITKSLVNFVNIHQISTLVTRPPKFYGSHASKVIEVLRTTHKDRVKMPTEDFERFVAWIDCNAAYYGTYIYTRPNTVGGQEIFAHQKAALADTFKRRCASCHGGNGDAQMLRVRLPEVEKTRALLAPLAKAAGGEETCKGKGRTGELTGAPVAVFADKNDPDYQKLAALYTQVKVECEQDPRPDMMDGWPAPTDPKCRYVYRPGSVREAPR